MTLMQTLGACSQDGIVLRVVNEELHYEAPTGKMSEELKAAIRQQKEALVELLSALQGDPECSPFSALIRHAREGRLQLNGYILSDFRTVTDGNRFVLWALGEIEKNTHHRMECICQLAKLAVTPFVNVSVKPTPKNEE